MYGYMQKTKAAQASKAQSRPLIDSGARPFSEVAEIIVTCGDYEHARWRGKTDLPVGIGFASLAVVERLPWKLLEVCEDRERQIRWFRRA